MLRIGWVLVFIVLAATTGCGPKGPLPEKPASNVGRCVYVNGFSSRQECREYRGDGWTEAAAVGDCKGEGAALEAGEVCDYASTIGVCVLGEPGKYRWIVMPGDDTSVCSSAQRGCEFFGGGIFGPSPLCGGVAPGTGGTGLPTFQWPKRCAWPQRRGSRQARGPRGRCAPGR